MMKKAVKVLLVLLVIGIAIQFIRPSLDNRPATASLAAPPEVKAILQRACYDCHSNQTRLAWFDQPAPAYWLVVKDVRAGRKVLNFSDWNSLPKGQQAGKIFESIFQVEQNAMPLPPYRLLHHGAILSPEEITTLKGYALSLGYKAVPDTARDRALAVQYQKWLNALPTDGQAKSEYNGIGYAELADFANWKAVSTTERYDNGTFRLILGNEIAQKAIKEGHTHPWPDGTTFAKVAWDQAPDTSGVIHAGAFKQVEFMIRDQKKYDSTLGWGFARWVGGLELKPYGKNAAFVTECVNCHRPLKSTDYTFTFPLQDTIKMRPPEVDSPAGLTWSPLNQKVITTLVHKKGSIGQDSSGTMSTLYGNDIAVREARLGQPYTPGAVLTLVTWYQRDDPHWFGGRIPNELYLIETLEFRAKYPPYYKMFPPHFLNDAVEPEASTVMERTAEISRLKAAVLPGVH